jgi:hypothetical protein
MSPTGWCRSSRYERASRREPDRRAAGARGPPPPARRPRDCAQIHRREPPADARPPRLRGSSRDPSDRHRAARRRRAARLPFLVALPLSRGRREAGAALRGAEPQRADDPARPHPRDRCDRAVRPPAPRPGQGRRGGGCRRPLEGGAVAGGGLARAGRSASRVSPRRAPGGRRGRAPRGAAGLPGHVKAAGARRSHQHALPPRPGGRGRGGVQPRRRPAGRDRRPGGRRRGGQVPDGRSRHRARRRAGDRPRPPRGHRGLPARGLAVHAARRRRAAGRLARPAHAARRPPRPRSDPRCRRAGLPAASSAPPLVRERDRRRAQRTDRRHGSRPRH